MSGRQIQNLTAAEVFARLGSRDAGLSAREVLERRQEVGRNSVEIPDRWKHLRSLLHQFTNFFTLLLLFSAGLCFVAEKVQPGENMDVLGGALLGVAVLNALFSFLQSWRAERAMAALRAFLPQTVRVRRDGETVDILAEELVPGDVLLIGEGERVAADARLIDCNGLLVNNAPLTGEAQPVNLTAAAVESRLVESANLVFAGCGVLRGSGTAVVFATGLRTEFGKLAHLSQSIRRLPSPLEKETAHMVRVLTVIALLMGGGFFTWGLLHGRSLIVNLVFMMGIIVANVPEGLLPTFTLSLAMASLRMAKKNVLVKGLNAVEALGAVQMICTDKTGTLTCNRLAVTRLQTVDEDDGLLLRAALVASEVRQGDAGWHGDPLDVALAERLAADGEDVAAIAATVRRFEPFDPERRRSLGVGRVNDEERICAKGAWEALAPLLQGMDKSRLQAAEEELQQLAGSGLRVLAVAARPLRAGEADAIAGLAVEQLENGLEFLGFFGVEDPVRAEVKDAVSRCHAAGIDVLMITGDHPQTALAVAVASGIVAPGAEKTLVLTGAELTDLEQAVVAERVEQGVRIFARTTPAQKMKIVAALKGREKVVAMTGDGVNDAPALKAADVGVAMGKSGTDVARAAAQIILLDDNFASIVAGIEEGRTVFANIRKFTNYVLVSNGPEILPYLLYILLPVPLALTVIQILCIDLGTDIVPSMALGQEPPDPEVMSQPPRGRDVRLLSPALVMHSYLFLGLVEAAWSLSLFFLALHLGGWQYGESLSAADPLYRGATGLALATILLMQIGNLAGRRFRFRSGLDAGLWRNRLLLLGIVVQVVFSWALLYLPPLQAVLGTAPVPPALYLLAWIGIPLIFGLDYLRKRVYMIMLRRRQADED